MGDYTPKDIKEKYAEVFQAAILASRLIQSEFYVEVSEDEVGYITIHFGAALERINYQEKKKARVAIVCSSGVGTTNLLEVRLNNFLLSSTKSKTNNHSGGNKISKSEVLKNLFSDGILMFEVFEHPSPLEEERTLIESYVKEFGEKPPLNG